MCIFLYVLWHVFVRAICCFMFALFIDSRTADTREGIKVEAMSLTVGHALKQRRDDFCVSRHMNPIVMITTSEVCMHTQTAGFYHNSLVFRHTALRASDEIH